MMAFPGRFGQRNVPLIDQGNQKMNEIAEVGIHALNA